MAMNRRDKKLPCEFWHKGPNTGSFIPCYCSFERALPIPIFKWQLCRKVKYEKKILLSCEDNSKIINEGHNAFAKSSN
jgi:hypothetical protein